MIEQRKARASNEMAREARRTNDDGDRGVPGLELSRTKTVEGMVRGGRSSSTTTALCRTTATKAFLCKQVSSVIRAIPNLRIDNIAMQAIPRHEPERGEASKGVKERKPPRERVADSPGLACHRRFVRVTSLPSYHIIEVDMQPGRNSSSKYRYTWVPLTYGISVKSLTDLLRRA